MSGRRKTETLGGAAGVGIAGEVAHLQARVCARTSARELGACESVRVGTSAATVRGQNTMTLSGLTLGGVQGRGGHQGPTLGSVADRYTCTGALGFAAAARQKKMGLGGHACVRTARRSRGGAARASTSKRAHKARHVHGSKAGRHCTWGVGVAHLAFLDAAAKRR
jgi:hypothetical protein